MKRNELEIIAKNRWTVLVRKLFTSALFARGILAVQALWEELNETQWGWDSRVCVQDFLTEDTGRGHSLGSEIEGWFASV